MAGVILVVLVGLSLFAIAALIILVLATRRPTRTCPYCAERIQPDAAICRYCGRDLAGPVTGRDVLGGPEHDLTAVSSSDRGAAPPDGPVDWEVEHGDKPAPGADPVGPDA